MNGFGLGFGGAVPRVGDDVAKPRSATSERANQTSKFDALLIEHRRRTTEPHDLATLIADVMRVILLELRPSETKIDTGDLSPVKEASSTTEAVQAAPEGKNGTSSAEVSTTVAKPSAEESFANEVRRALERAEDGIRLPHDLEVLEVSQTGAKVVIGDGVDRIALAIRIEGNAVYVEAELASGELAEGISDSGLELRDALRQHGLELGSLALSITPPRRSSEENTGTEDSGDGEHRRIVRVIA